MIKRRKEKAGSGRFCDKIPKRKEISFSGLTKAFSGSIMTAKTEYPVSKALTGIRAVAAERWRHRAQV